MKIRVIYVLSGIISVAFLITGFSFPRFFSLRKEGLQARQCRSTLIPERLRLPPSLSLSDDLEIEFQLRGDPLPNSLPKTLKIDDASLYGMVDRRGGFFRPLDPLVAEQDDSGVYHAQVNLASWATKRNLWPLVEKAQNEWNVQAVETQLSFSVADNRGCRSPEVSTKIEIQIAGVTRNNAIHGSPPAILNIEAPEEVHFGESFVIRGEVEDEDDDLSDPLPIEGFISIDGIPGQLPLPPKIQVVRKEPGVFEAIVGPEQFGVYRQLLKLWPLESIDVTIVFYIEDQAGHYSNVEKISLSVMKS